jgi:SM-20-related protein
MDDEGIEEQNQFEYLIKGLIDNQYGCCNDFLAPSTVLGLRANMTTLNTLGNLLSAGIGNKMDLQKDASIRGDVISWIEEQSTNEHEELYLKKIWRFINYLNKTCFTSIKTFESHYANYELGSFYKRHLDQFKNEKGRQYSIILYLNEDWTENDKGMLSLYPLKDTQKDILPLGGRMVFFKSDDMEHEVHPSLTRNRKSIAGWLKN